MVYRRKFIVGLFGAISVSGGLISNGAFSSAQITRKANIAVVSDSRSLIGLVPNPDVAGVNDNQGELTIDLDDPGINQNSIYQFGLFTANDNISTGGDFPLTTDTPSERENGGFGSAFLIANQTDNKQRLNIKYQLGQTDNKKGDSFETSYWFEVHRDGSRSAILDSPVDGTATVTLGSGETCGVSRLVDVPEGPIGEEITGNLAITAGQAVNDNEKTTQ